MAQNITHLPHIKNVKAGINKYDPVHRSIYEVYFTLPEAIQSEFKDEELILTEQVTSVSGLDVLFPPRKESSIFFLDFDLDFEFLLFKEVLKSFGFKVIFFLKIISLTNISN